MVMMSDMMSTIGMDGYWDNQTKLGAEVLG